MLGSMFSKKQKQKKKCTHYDNLVIGRSFNVKYESTSNKLQNFLNFPLLKGKNHTTAIIESYHIASVSAT